MMRRRVNRQVGILGRGRYGPELLANAGVERGAESPDDWFSSANTEWATAEARTGGRSLRIHVNNEAADWRAAAFSAEPGVMYRLRAYVKGEGSGQTFLTIRWWRDGAATQFIGEDNIPLPGIYPNWTLAGEHFRAPAETQAADVLFRCPAATTADIYGDDFSVRQVNA